jgi:hypothetical protein
MVHRARAPIHTGVRPAPAAYALLGGSVNPKPALLGSGKQLVLIALHPGCYIDPIRDGLLVR